MKKNVFSKVLAMLLVVVMFVGILPIDALAAIEYDPSANTDDYYKVISKQDWELAPGIQETEIVLNNDDGSKRQVVHSVKIDMNNPYTKVIPGYKGMIPTAGNYGTESTSTQAKNAEALGYGNVVAATNAMLSWYDSAYYKAHPELIGEPLYYNILDGYYYENSQGAATFASRNAVVVINYDYHPISGEKRPDDMPKVLMRSQTDPLTGWEQNAISVWEWLVKPDANGVPKTTYTENHSSGHESRTFVGITAEGEIILSVADGRQAPYSTGFSMYEMGEYMIKMGCIYAANCDGGGSTTFVSERPGEELKVNCSLSDGGERPTTNTFLVISTAPASGEFERATLSTEYDYYTPGSSVTFDALGTDAVGTKVDVPADIEWTIKEEGMGTIENGVFTSNGTPGQVTAQMLYNGEVVGERTITLALPDKLSFSQPVVTIPYGTRAMIPVKATLDGLYEIGLSPEDVTITSANAALGTVDGLHFVGAEAAPADNSSAVTVTLKVDPTITASATLKLGEASVVMWDFEDGQADIDEWNSIVLRNPGEAHRDFYHKLSLATKEDGQVHDGNYSMRLETNGLSSADVHSKQYAYVRLGLKDQKITLENARSLGFWLYVPEDNIQCWVQGFYKYDTNGDGTPDTLAEVNLMNSENVYYNVDESGWHYLSMDLSDFEKVDLTYSSPFDADPSDGATVGDKDEFFLVLIFHKSINNILWQTNGSINGPFTYYIDNITVDYSEMVDDREAPIFESVVMDNSGVNTNMTKHGVVTTTDNALNIIANVAEATYRADGTGTKHTLYNYTGLDAASAKVYFDGVEVDCVYANGKISISDIAVADGYHRVKFEICDNAGNKSTVVRLVKVESGKKASTLELVPADPALVEKDRLDFGSIFWMNLVATNIDTIQSVETVIDLNSVNHWELDHMVLADGFSATYTIDDETNTATITFARTGTVYRAGEAVLAQIPIRIIYFDTDMKIPGYTAETVWTKYNFWPHDLKVDVDKGEITYVDGYENSALNTFSNGQFQVNTEMYTDYQSMGSDPYYAEHGTTHVHTPVVLPDKAADCTDGYIGRTFCAACNSVVDWGTIVSATTEHNYAVVDGKFSCTVGGELFHGTYIDGTVYYNGVVVTDGWLEIGGVKTYYYKDGIKLTGSHFFDGAMHTFDKNGVYLPDYKYDGFYEINDTVMYFVNNEYRTGMVRINNFNYNFYDTGLAYNGEIVIDGVSCLFEKGLFVAAENVIFAGICGENAHFVLTTDGVMTITGEGDMANNYTTIGLVPWYDYEYRSKIKKVVIDKDITSIGQRAFINSPKLSEVVFEEGSKLKAIHAHVFNQCPALVTITLPEGLESIGAYALGCSFKPETLAQLKQVYLPASVKEINRDAFKGHHADLMLTVEEGTYAHTYAVSKGFNVEVNPYQPLVIAGGECGENATWMLNEFGGLVISGRGAMTNYSSKVAVPWDAYRKSIKTITIGKDITGISDYAFGWCHYVETVTFEEGSKVEYIGRNAFHSFTKVTEIVLPDTVKTIGFSAFGYGTKLVSVKLSSTVTYIHPDAFLNHASGLVLTVEEGTYAYKFADSKGINTNVIPYRPAIIAGGECGTNAIWTLNEFGDLVISGSGAMTNYSSKVAVPWDAYRKSIKTITIGKDITGISDYAFGWCHYVETVTFEEGSKVEYIGRNAFHSFTKVTEIVLPETVKTIGFAAFGYGTKLVSVNLPSTVTYIHPDAFLNHASGLVLTVEEGSYAHKYANDKGVQTNVLPYTPSIIAEGACGDKATWTLNEFGDLVISGSGAMTNYSGKVAVPWDAYRKSIKTITIGKDITGIADYAFGWCHYVENVTFEEGSKVEYIGRNAFHSFTKITEIVLPETVKTIGFSAFGYGTKLVSVNLPSTVTYIHPDAFLNHASGLVLTVEEGTYAYKFAESKGINTNVIPYTPAIIAGGECGANAIWTLNEFGDLVISGSGAMTNYSGKVAVPWDAYRKSIKTITIGKDITGISDYAFGWCHYVETVTFEEGSKVEYIGRNAFHSFTKVTEIVLPETVKTIGFSAFGYGTKLVSVNLPASVTYIHPDAFLNHSSELVLTVEANSYAADYAAEKGITVTVK